LSTFAKWKETATPDEVAVSVCLNRRLFREFQEASAELERARESGMLEQPEGVQTLAERVVALKEQVDADQAEHTFVFATMPYGQWRELAEAHPPTDEQKADNRYLDFNPDTFPAAAVAASSISPELDEADGEWLRENLPRAEFDRLFQAAMQANVGGSSIPLSVSGIVGRLSSELKSITAANGASPSPSSVDGS
jgi:hypothetical protein